jgi:POT family proton-dependent oligopeptide transporter
VATNPSALPHGDSQGTFLGHPKGLFVLFFAEMWERFSYYGMRALLILYLTKHWLYSDGDASVIYGAYTALVYITPVIGGYLADKYLGQRKAVLFGAVLLTIGHCFMAFEGNGSGHENDPALNIFWLALAFIIVGWGKPLLLGRGEAPDPARLARPGLGGIRFEWLLYLSGVVAVGVVWLLIQYQALVGTLLGLAGAILVAYVLYTAVAKLPREDRDRIFAAMFLILGSILFWALFEQAGSSLNLFADRYVDAPVPASTLQAINPGYIILLGPVFAALWTMLGRRGLEPSAPAKFGLALIQLGAGFLVLVAGATAVGVDVPTPVIFIFLIYLLHTTGELCLSPVGLSAMNRLAPAHLASLIMGTWFFASATGNFAAGLIAAATGSEHGVGEGAAKEVVLGVYSNIGWISVGVGVAVIVISPLIKKLMHLDTLRDTEELAGYKEIGGDRGQDAGMFPQDETKPENKQL